MNKVFEDYFSELQADMVSICLEYVDNRAEKIYIYGSCEETIISSDFFYCIGGKIKERHRLNDNIENNQYIYDTSSKRQDMVLDILIEDIKKIKDLCKKYSREMPTEIKLIYDVQKNNLKVEYKYDLVYYNDPVKTADDISMEWFEKIKLENIK
ncbi:hypothetical protein AB2T96_07670 [Clostridium butyricum]|uniref:hypothetical protein n=1 Tax=Clostridium butyricum TaxID=1492 RepID=UPI001CA81779|nr:hypothetical protein [Clostridium butyricum]MBZ0312670.1 hypothetical protein [Clostridium butyricum]